MHTLGCSIMHVTRSILHWAAFCFVAAVLITTLFASVVQQSAYRQSRTVRGHRYTYFATARDQAVRLLWNPPSQRERPSSPYSSAPVPKGIRASYEEDVVLRFTITCEEHARALAEAASTLFLDIWGSSRDWVDIRIAKDVVPSLYGLLPESLKPPAGKWSSTPLLHDLSQAVFETYPSDPSAPPCHSSNGFTSARSGPARPTNLFFQNYQPLSVIVPWMRLIQSLFPSHVRLVNLGISYEGRDILGFKLGVHPTNSERPTGPRKSIVISGGSHAREWVSVSTVNYIAYSFATFYGRDRDITKLLEEFDIVLIPTLNPDGYVFTWEHDRLWRKNRQDTNLRFCKGLDIDRSFGFQWDGVSTSGNPCSESFAGDAPFEAVESARFANWVKDQSSSGNSTFAAYLDLHSYSQQVLYPFSFSCVDTPPSLENLEELALVLSKAIHQTHHEWYSVAPACQGNVAPIAGASSSEEQRPTAGRQGGSVLDWMYHDMNVRYSYQLKLRDTGTHGFLLPSKYIQPTGEEVFAAVKALGLYLSGDHGIER